MESKKAKTDIAVSKKPNDQNKLLNVFFFKYLFSDIINNINIIILLTIILKIEII